jgi:hypothetical protein
VRGTRWDRRAWRSRRSFSSLISPPSVGSSCSEILVRGLHGGRIRECPTLLVERSASDHRRTHMDMGRECVFVTVRRTRENTYLYYRYTKLTITSFTHWDYDYGRTTPRQLSSSFSNKMLETISPTISFMTSNPFCERISMSQPPSRESWGSQPVIGPFVGLVSPVMASWT